MQDDDFVFPQPIIRGLGAFPVVPPRPTALEQSQQPTLQVKAPEGVGQGSDKRERHDGDSPVAVAGDAGGDGATGVIQAHHPLEQSSTAPHISVQKLGDGDPNYYASTPQFDPRGFWHSAGTFPPVGVPRGTPAGSTGSWHQQGHANRNGLSTNQWIWYPDGPLLVGGASVGSVQQDYLISQMPIDSAFGSTENDNRINSMLRSGVQLKWQHLFANPDYYVATIFDDSLKFNRKK
jgi:hypothetical protein